MAYLKPGIKQWKYYKCIDPEITELIILQHALGFQTIASCAGHQKGTSHIEETAHVKKQCEEQGIEFDEDMHDNFYFHIFYYMPEPGKIKKLKRIYEKSRAYLKGLLSPEKLKGFVLSEEKSIKGLRYAAMQVENHKIWTGTDYTILRQKLTDVTRAQIKSPSLEQKIRETYERTKQDR